MSNRWRMAFVAVMLGLAELAPANDSPAEPVRLTLAEAIELALAHNRDLARGTLDVESSEMALRSARESVRGLQLTPDGSAGWGPDGEDWRAGFRAQATASPGTRVGVSAAARQIEVDGSSRFRRGEVQVEISQPLFRNFGSIVRNEPVAASTDSLRTVRRVWERDRSALVVRVVELYEELVLLRFQIESDEAFAARLDRLWALADARERLGRTSRTEVMRMDLQRGEAAVRLETGRSRLAIQFQEFANLLGQPIESMFRLQPPELLDLNVPDPERALGVALSERTDYAQALQDIESSDRQWRLARRALLPDLRLTARRSVFGEGDDWSQAGRLEEDDWFVGLTGDVNLNVRGAWLDAKRSELDVDSRRQAAEIVRHRLALEVNSAVATYRRTRAELELAIRNRELAANRAELARALFEAGRASADTVSDAEADFLSAELTALSAQREASLSAYRLLHALGTLVPAPRELLMREGRI